eukprot:10205430-Lingulodinium_polyedra.AAC.1
MVLEPLRRTTRCASFPRELVDSSAETDYRGYPWAQVDADSCSAIWLQVAAAFNLLSSFEPRDDAIRSNRPVAWKQD